METLMRSTIARTACVLALSTGTGCADIYFTYAEDAALPILVQDVGSACETDDPVYTEIARVHVEQQGSECIITADALVRAIEYQDIVDSLNGVPLDQAEWIDGGICWRAAEEGDGTLAYEKCDYGPNVQASWRLAGDEDWLPDPQFPPNASADLSLSYYPGPAESLDDVSGQDPGMTFSTSGQTFPLGEVVFSSNEFYGPFEQAVPDDLYSLAHARVDVPMSDIAEFTQHEYEIDFSYQMYVQGYVEKQSLFELLLDSLFGGGSD
jgi:hypothetical protein